MNSLYQLCIITIADKIINRRSTFLYKGESFVQKNFVSLKDLSMILPAELFYDIQQEYYSKISPKEALEELNQCCKDQDNRSVMLLFRSLKSKSEAKGVWEWNTTIDIVYEIWCYILFLAYKYDNPDLIDLLKQDKSFFVEQDIAIQNIQAYSAGVMGRTISKQIIFDCISGENFWPYFEFLKGLCDGGYRRTLSEEILSDAFRYFCF